MGNGGDLLVRVLREHGVAVVFGIVSVHNLPLVAAVARDLRFVAVRHEAAAVNAADAYARASGGLGCALTSTGTGAGNAAGSLVEALSAGSRVLHITGNIESGFLGQARGVIHETKDQLGMLTAVSKAAYTVTLAAPAAGILRVAAAEARAYPSGPVSVEWPIDLQYAQQADAAVTAEVARTGPRAGTDEIGEAAAMLAAAKRPAIWAGGGARDAGAPLRELAERLGAAIFTSNAGRGSVSEDHDLVIGNFAATPAGSALLAQADVLLSVGTHFRSNETAHYKLALPATHIQVDLNPAALGRSYPVTRGLAGEAAATLTALCAALPEVTQAEADWRGKVTAARATTRANLYRDIGAYGLICDSMRRHLPAAAPIARDVTIPSSQWGNRLLPILEPGTNVFPLGGGIGQGLAMGVGAALACPDVPTLVIAGDGGLAVHLGELMTLAQERPWLVLVVFNDGGYGVLRNMQDKYAGRRSGVDLFTPDFGLLAAAVDIPFTRVKDAAAFDEAFAAAVAERGPYLVEVDITSVGPTPVQFTPPVAIPGRH
jgi:acetolactate synthase-1/2/3 large subunit